MENMKKNIELRVKNLIKKHGTKNPFEICKKLGIRVIYFDLGEIKGYHTKALRVNFIFINSRMSHFLQFLALLHELGHVVLKHSSKNISFMKDHIFNFSNSLENEANLFMIEFLSFLEELDFDITDEERKILNKAMQLKNKF